MVAGTLPNSLGRVHPRIQQLADWTVEWEDNEASGPCPRCGHPMTFELKTILVEASIDQGAEQLTRRVDCACEVAHPTGEISAVSCGAFWYATFRLPPAQPQVIPPLDPRVVVAADAFDKSAKDEELRLRAAAEKWVSGVAAVLALLSIAATVTGGKLFEDLPYLGKAFVVGLVVLAVAAALGAVIASYKAAYGWPKQVDVSDDDKLLEWYDARADRLKSVADRLRLGVTLAGVALCLLTVAATVSWLTPPATPEPTVKLTLENESTRCGDLLAPKKVGYVRVRSADNGDAVEIFAADVVSIEAVKTC